MEGRVFGYARVSSQEQNLDRQIIALRQHVQDENIICDKASGKNTDREGYKALKGPMGLRNGDVLYIMSLDRLSRSKKDIKRELEWFKANNVRLKILDLPTSLIDVPDGQEWILDMVTNILVEVLASIAEQERLTIRKRQREGIDAAKAKGKYLGRPKVEMPTNFTTAYLKWKNGEQTAVQTMQNLGLKRTSFYKLVHEYENSVRNASTSLRTCS